MADTGRPPKYKTAESMQEAIDEYFRDCEYDEDGNVRENIKPPTVSGLAYHLGFLDRKSVSEYAHKDEFTDTIKKARMRIEQYLETRLTSNAVAGIIFNLKNNFGWKDKSEIEHSGNLATMSDQELDAKLKAMLSTIDKDD